MHQPVVFPSSLGVKTNSSCGGEGSGTGGAAARSQPESRSANPHSLLVIVLSRHLQSFGEFRLPDFPHHPGSGLPETGARIVPHHLERPVHRRLPQKVKPEKRVSDHAVVLILQTPN